MRELHFQAKAGGQGISTNASGAPVLERFNSRTHNKVMTSEPTNPTSGAVPYEATADDVINEIGSSSKSRQLIHNSVEMSHSSHQQYGTHPALNPHGQMSSGQAKKISQSINRRNHQGGLQDTGSGLAMDHNSQEHASQHSSKNFNSLRNSMSMNKKLSATAAKKSKKLKKSESLARHQHQSKSELMTAQAARSQAENGEKVVSDNGHSAYMTNANAQPAETATNGKNSSL